MAIVAAPRRDRCSTRAHDEFSSAAYGYQLDRQAMSNIHRSFCAALVSCAIAVRVGTAGAGGDESPWNEVRTIRRQADRRQQQNGRRQCSAPESRVKLRPGWKTYWRYPGDSGVPPQFDFSGSENLKKADGALSGAASVHRRDGSIAWLQGHGHISHCRFTAAGRQAGPAPREGRLRGLRETMRAR